MNIEIFIIENTQVNQLKPPNRQCNDEALFIPILDETNKWLKLYFYFVSLSLGQLWPDLQSCHGFSVLSFIQQRKDPRIQSEKIYRRFQFPRMSLKVLIKIFLGSAKLSVNKFISDETFSLSFSQTFLLFHLEHCEKYFANFCGNSNQKFRPKDPTRNLSVRYDPDPPALDDYSRIISDINIDEVLSLFVEKQSPLIK